MLAGGDTSLKISPFAPASLPDLPPIAGVRCAACEAGIRYQGRKDLMLALLAPGTTVAGVLTQSSTAAAPVEWCRSQLGNGKARALVVNSGNANAFTGLKGSKAVEMTVDAAARAAGCAQGEVFVASTGVIGEPLDPSQFIKYLDGLAEAAHGKAWEAAARAIMTTDTYPKLATERVKIGDSGTIINGIAKGSGMIAPNMATMLAFLFTDAAIEAPVLQTLCSDLVDETFNCISVDGDTSTSDTVLLFATGQAASKQEPPIASTDDPRLGDFKIALHRVMLDLAHQIVKDGEGAQKFTAIHVDGAEHDAAARRIAFSIANSPLVKTAIAGEDPNWGRIVMAVGKSGETVDRDKLAIWFGDMRVAAGGEVDPDYQEDRAAHYMKGRELDVRVSVGAGSGSATVWTCDLTHDYISINADYRS